MRFCTVCLLLFVLIRELKAEDDVWTTVRETLDGWEAMDSFSFSAGDISGRKFTYERGLTKMSTRIPVASGSKFPVGVAIGRVVASGYLSFDTKANEVFKWWTQDESDLRSGVTLRQLLSFTSGFYSSDAAGNMDCLTALDASVKYTSEECAKQIYQDAPFEFTPGSTFDYNSYHLQIAGAMAAKAANITVPQLIQTYLFAPAGMNRSTYLGQNYGLNPYLAAGLITNGDDYDSFLRHYLNYELVNQSIANQMEIDYTPSKQVNVSNVSTELIDMIGHYSMCNWYECLNASSFTRQCSQSLIHMDAV